MVGAMVDTIVGAMVGAMVDTIVDAMVDAMFEETPRFGVTSATVTPAVAGLLIRDDWGDNGRQRCYAGHSGGSSNAEGTA